MHPLHCLICSSTACWHNCRIAPSYTCTLLVLSHSLRASSSTMNNNYLEPIILKPHHNHNSYLNRKKRPLIQLISAAFSATIMLLFAGESPHSISSTLIPDFSHLQSLEPQSKPWPWSLSWRISLFSSSHYLPLHSLQSPKVGHSVTTRPAPTIPPTLCPSTFQASGRGLDQERLRLGHQL